MLNFRSKNDIKKSFFKKMLDRFIDLDKYIEKIGVRIDRYPYFIELLNLFINAKDLSKNLQNTSNIFLDMNRAIFKNFLDFLSESYNNYTDEFKKIVLSKNNIQHTIKFRQLDIYPYSLYYKNCQLSYKNFMQIYKNKEIINARLSQNNSEDINKIKEIIEKLYKTIFSLNEKLTKELQNEINSNKIRANLRKKQSNEARIQQNIINSQPVINKNKNWKSMYRQATEYNEGENIPTDPREIELAKKRFALLQEMKRLEKISKSCTTYNQQTTFTPEQYKVCSNANNKLQSLIKSSTLSTSSIINSRPEHHWSHL